MNKYRSKQKYQFIYIIYIHLFIGFFCRILELKNIFTKINDVVASLFSSCSPYSDAVFSSSWVLSHAQATEPDWAEHMPTVTSPVIWGCHLGRLQWPVEPLVLTGLMFANTRSKDMPTQRKMTTADSLAVNLGGCCGGWLPPIFSTFRVWIYFTQLGNL